MKAKIKTEKKALTKSLAKAIKKAEKNTAAARVGNPGKYIEETWTLGIRVPASMYYELQKDV